MRIVNSKTGNAAVITAANHISKKLSKIYTVVENATANNVSDIKAVIKEAYSRIATENAAPSELKSETIYRIFGEAAKGNKQAQEAIRSAFIADIALDYKNDPIKAENMVALMNSLFNNLFDVTKLETANITGQFIPYTMYAAPLLRFMIPKLIATDLFTVTPMKGPLAKLYFMKMYQEGSTNPYPFAAFLNVDNDGNLVAGDALAGYGTNPGGVVSINIPANSTQVSDNLVDVLKANNLVPATLQGPIQRGSFDIVGIVVNNQVLPVTATIDPAKGTFIATHNSGYTVSGRVDYATGDITILVNSNDITAVNVSARVTYEVRDPARKIKLEAADYDIREQRIEETLLMSPEFLHDVKMLFDVDLQSEMVSILSSLIALNTDAYLLMNLYNTAKAMNDTSLTVTASATVPGGAVFPTPKMWYEGEFIPKIFKLEGTLRKNTPSYDVEPILVMNTIDAQYVRSVDKYTADVSDSNTVFLAKRVNGTLDNVIKIITTPILPKGVNLMVLKSNNPLFATAVYAPYVTQLIPYPANTIGPAMTAVHRFGTIVPWSKAIGIFKVTE